MLTNTVAIVSLLLLVLGRSGQTSEECRAISGVFEIDHTVNVKDEERQRMLWVANGVASKLPSGSRADISLVGDRNTYIDSFDDGISDIFLNVPDAHSRTITASAIEDGIKRTFLKSQLKTKAEIIYLFISESTPVDEVPSAVLHKKTNVIVFGTSVPSSAKTIATSSSHIYLVRNDDDIVDTTQLIRQQTCLDSHYVCDVDMYKENRVYSACKSCYYVCAQKQIRQNGCKPCPYIRPEPKVQEVMSKSGKKEDDPMKYVKDNKISFLTATFVSLAVVFVASVVLSSLYVCYRKHVACFHHEPRNVGGYQRPEIDGVGVDQGLDGEIAPEEADGNDIPLVRVHEGLGIEEEGIVADGQRYINVQQGYSMHGIEETSV